MKECFKLTSKQNHNSYFRHINKLRVSISIWSLYILLPSSKYKIACHLIASLNASIFPPCKAARLTVRQSKVFANRKETLRSMQTCTHTMRLEILTHSLFFRLQRHTMALVKLNFK